MNNFPSKLVEEAVNELSKLPGIGRKTAIRLALHILRKEPSHAQNLGNAIIDMRNNIKFCTSCHNVSDTDVCHICANPYRDKSLICVIEDVRDMLAIENTGQYTGVYHILGGVISPMDGIGPENLNINSLVNKIANNTVKEIILALRTTIEGDTTNIYLYKKIKNNDVKVSVIARGVAIGDELEFTDEITLGRSIVNRTPYETLIID
ncbi:MAG: recombination mediator RecR [Bacteroidales bacterium]|nr:recombination mediator RecR [Bacteroidales bacterium]